MKSFILFVIFICLFTCSNSDETITVPIESNKVLLLKVDYTAHSLEGAKELIFEESTDNFEISFEYQAPGDFGNIKLFYNQLDEVIFDGTIIWLGTGEIAFPDTFISAESLNTIDNSLELPSLSLFQNVIYDEFAYYPEDIDYSSMWNAIDNLELVSEYRSSNPNSSINVFLYTPSVGIGNPLEWDYFIILKN